MSLADTVKLRGSEIAKLSHKIHRQRLTIRRLKEYNFLLHTKLQLIEATDRVIAANEAISEIAARGPSAKTMLSDKDKERLEELLSTPV